MKGVQLAYREHDDGTDMFLVLIEEGVETHLEWDFILEAIRLRKHDLESFEVVWHLVDLFNDRMKLDGFSE